MKVSVYRTPKVTSRSHDLMKLLDDAVPELRDGCVVAVAAKIVSLCEGRVVPVEGTDKDELIRQESQWFLPRGGKYHLAFAITRNMLIPTAGIDESNAGGYYILWPKDLQASVNAIRDHLVKRHGLKRVGVIITDSTTRPLQWGTTGLGIAYSGINPLKDYVGQLDVFGRRLEFQKSNLVNGLAAAAVLMMGEGNEQTPVALIEDLDFVEFQPRNPTEAELKSLRMEREDDLYWPFLKPAPWEKGDL